MASVVIRWQCAEDQAIEVEVDSEADHPDALDDMSRRAVYLLTEALAAVVVPEQPVAE